MLYSHYVPPNTNKNKPYIKSACAYHISQEPLLLHLKTYFPNEVPISRGNNKNNMNKLRCYDNDDILKRKSDLSSCKC